MEKVDWFGVIFAAFAITFVIGHVIFGRRP